MNISTVTKFDALYLKRHSPDVKHMRLTRLEFLNELKALNQEKAIRSLSFHTLVS